MLAAATTAMAFQPWTPPIVNNCYPSAAFPSWAESELDAHTSICDPWEYDEDCTVHLIESYAEAYYYNSQLLLWYPDQNVQPAGGFYDTYGYGVCQWVAWAQSCWTQSWGPPGTVTVDEMDDILSQIDNSAPVLARTQAEQCMD
jgi:hypothetical protein